MIPSFVHGPIAPVFTACNADGSLDDDGQRQLLDFLFTSDAISAHFLRCGMGQMYTFRYDEVRQLTRNVCSHVAGRAPVLMGTSGEWDRNRDRLPDPDVYVRQGIELGKYAEDCGAAGVVFTMPEAILPKTGQTPKDVILWYFETLCDALQGPIFIYQPPGTAEEYRVTIDTVRALADMPKIKGMKISTNDAQYIVDICWAVAGKDFGFISGAETAFLAGLCAGSRGVIGQGSTLNPEILKAIQDRYDAGDMWGAVEAQRTANMLVEESKNSVEFFKRYAAEKGYRVQPYSRTLDDNPYKKQQSSLTKDEYEAFKRIYEAERAKYL